jgi:glycine/D-amino acid oxidase-like deaminating enzyme
VSVSYWLEDPGDDVSPRPPLDGSRTVDVAIVGAGFTGLWTARELLRRDPALEVLVLEAETAGFGASGRNGAWLTNGIGVTPGELARRNSPETARATVEAMRETVAAVIASCEEDGIDAQIRRAGTLRVARGAHEAPSLQAAMGTLRRLGVADDLSLLTATELTDRIRIPGAMGALHDPHAATIHPGRLVRGLARRVEELGATIVEHTPVLEVVPRGGGRRATRGRGNGGRASGHARSGDPQPRTSGRVRLTTPRGDVHADAVVLACEAWLPRLRGYRRAVLPLYSLIVLTEPLPERAWEAIGWEGHELVASHRLTVDYLSRTVDGRILLGGRGAPYHYGSQVTPAFDRHPATHALLERHLSAWFPVLEGVRVTHRWGGPLAMPRDWLPSFRFDPATGIGAAYGYTGQGVAATNLAGRVLADLIVHGDTPYRDLPMVGHRSRGWEPEPLRWLGARYVMTALTRLEARVERTGRRPTGRSLGERLARH